MKRYLAIDIGASSGRHIVGWREDGELRTKEAYRFPNGVQERNGHLVWDMDALLAHVQAGITAAKAEFPGIVSLSIDLGRGLCAAAGGRGSPPGVRLPGQPHRDGHSQGA